MNTGSVLAQFTISLSMAVNEPVSVDWHTSDGSAKAGVDYAANSGTVIFAPGQIAKTVDILVYGRAVGTEDRTFYVEMLPPTNAILGASIGQCVIHVDTTGSQPVTEIIIPTGPQGIQGKSAYQSYLDTTTDNPPMTETEWVKSLNGDPAEIAKEVAPLIDVGSTQLIAEGTETLGKPDTTTVKAIARRVAYAAAAKIATVILADGDNVISTADLNGDAINFNATGFVPRVLSNGVISEPTWEFGDAGKIIIKSATAGDVLYATEYGFSSQKNRMATQAEINDFISALNSPDNGKGDSLVRVKLAGVGFVDRTQHDKNDDVVSLKDAGAKGDGVTDDTSAIQKAYDSGRSVYIPDGVYISSGNTISSDNVTIYGPGQIVKKAGVNGRLLEVSGNGCHIRGVRFNGRNPAPNQMHYNNIIHITGENNIVSECFIDGSQGGGITIEGASNNKVINNTILDTHDNNIIISGEGANRNMVSGNICRGTVAQNNIFVTASADSSANGKFVYDNIIIGNSCADSADTGIEAGYHTMRTIIKGNICLNSYNPGILLRDNFGSIVDGNIIAVKAYASQHANYDGIAIVPQNEGAGNYSATIVNNTILGPTKRSGVYVGGSWVKVSNNTIYDNQSAINAAGDGLVGVGVLIVNGVSDVDVEANFIRRRQDAISLNAINAAVTVNRVNIRNNTILEAGNAFSCVKVTFQRCLISGNTVNIVKNAVLNLSDAAVGGGLKYLNNDVSLASFTAGVAVPEFYPETIVQSSCLITNSKTRVFDLPTNQGGFVVLSSPGLNSMGICLIQFADGSQSGVFAVGGKFGNGNNTVTKITGTDKIFGSDKSETFDGWTLFYKTETSDLVFQKRHSDAEPARKARITLIDL